LGEFGNTCGFDTRGGREVSLKKVNNEKPLVYQEETEMYSWWAPSLSA
jgi:hypothetical protein